MDKSYYEGAIKYGVDLEHQLLQKQSSFLRHILLVAASLLGVLISLHANAQTCLYIRLAFVLSLSLLSIGILCVGIAEYTFDILERKVLVDKYKQEVLNASRENREMQPVFGIGHKKLARIEKTAYTSLILALFSLLMYAVLFCLFN